MTLLGRRSLRQRGTLLQPVDPGSYEAFLIPTATQTANYTASPLDLVVCDTTSAAFTVTLPTAPADKTRIGAKIITQGGTNGVTVAAGGSDHIATGNAASRGLKLLGEAVELQYQASTALWFVPASDTPVGQLDLRFAKLSGGNTLTGDQLISSGALVQDYSVDVSHAPNFSQYGYNGRWYAGGLDLANTPRSRDYVPVAKYATYSINDAGTASGSPTLTSTAEGNFTAGQVGNALTGPGIPNGTTVLSVQSATSLTMSVNATATASGVRVTLTSPTNTLQDLIYISHNGGASPLIGIAITPPPTTHRLTVAADDGNTALGNLRLRLSPGQTGDVLTVTDSSSNAKITIDSAFRFNGVTVKADSTGSATALGIMSNDTLTSYSFTMPTASGNVMRLRCATTSTSVADFGTDGHVTFYGTVNINGTLAMTDGHHITTGTTTGTKIGTATTQKIGMFNAAPVVQATRVGQLTDSTTGTPSTTIGDAGATYSQATMNNIHASLLAKINALETRLSAAGGGIGITA
jgi:hypothetical protein